MEILRREVRKGFQEMSCFKNPRFAKELAYRTMVNYYLLRDSSKQGVLPSSPEFQRVLQKMQAEGFEVTMKYEVTLALNSMLGLLILPQQEYYSESLASCGFWKLPVLAECVNSTSFKNTYEEDRDKPALIIKHMRNAVAHDRIMMIPESADNKDITHIRFRDAAFLSAGKPCAFRNGGDLNKQIAAKKRRGETVYEFDLRISVDKLESVLMEISEYLISFAT